MQPTPGRTAARCRRRRCTSRSWTAQTADWMREGTRPGSRVKSIRAGSAASVPGTHRDRPALMPATSRTILACATLAAFAAAATTACIQARVVTKDGRQYNLDGSERVPPKQRAHDAMQALGACNRDVGKLQQSFRRDVAGTVASLA